jgi:asparagine synthase (glutamine-hydrolysing)
MCGFLAEINLHPVSKSIFRELLALSQLRGPDGTNYWTDQSMAQFGFNRLAILDTSEKGMQPIHSSCGRYVLMINGEIYNYRELKKKHSITDEVLRSGSDAEVLIHLIAHKGLEDILQQLDGMFAIVLMDREEDKLYIARDFAGIKPLYYGFFNQTFVCASQFNQVFLHPAFKSHIKLRPEIVKEYFGLGYMQAPNTVYEHIFQVNPGEFITFDLQTFQLTQRKRFYTWEEKPSKSESDPKLPTDFNTMFRKVISTQLQSDVPLATFLSGGIDSPLVTAHAHNENQEITAFTMEVEDSEMNESEIAKAYAEHFGVHQKMISFTDHELLESVQDHFRGIPEPHGDYSSIPTWLICKKAKTHATVMLSGDGGDELFWGYPRFIRSYKHLPWFRYSRWFRRLFMPFKRRFNHTLSIGPQLFDTFGEWTLHKQLNLFELEKLVPDTDYSVELKDVYAFNNNIPEDALLYLKRNEFYAHMQRVLRKVDLMSMANSVEVRVPFLSKDVIAFSNSIIPELGIKHQNPKTVLKKSLTQFIPMETIYQGKRGFAVPIDKWMRGPLKHDIEKIIFHTPIYGSDIINVDFLHQLVKDYFDGKNISAWGIWQIYAWQKWAWENGLIEDGGRMTDEGFMNI